MVKNSEKVNGYENGYSYVGGFLNVVEQGVSKQDRGGAVFRDEGDFFPVVVIKER